MKVLWSPLALRRLEENARYIARDKPGAARRWAESIFQTAGRLVDAPRSGRRVPEADRDDIRELLHGGYRIIYRLEPPTISILTIRHGRRLFDPDEIGDADE